MLEIKAAPSLDVNARYIIALALIKSRGINVRFTSVQERRFRGAICLVNIDEVAAIIRFTRRAP